MLEVIFFRERGFIGGSGALPLNFGQALEVVVAAVEAESALMVLQFVGSVEVEAALHTSVFG